MQFSYFILFLGICILTFESMHLSAAQIQEQHSLSTQDQQIIDNFNNIQDTSRKIIELEENIHKLSQAIPDKHHMLTHIISQILESFEQHIQSFKQYINNITINLHKEPFVDTARKQPLAPTDKKPIPLFAGLSWLNKTTPEQRQELLEELIKIDQQVKNAHTVITEFYKNISDYLQQLNSITTEDKQEKMKKLITIAMNLRNLQIPNLLRGTLEPLTVATGSLNLFIKTMQEEASLAQQSSVPVQQPPVTIQPTIQPPPAPVPSQSQGATQEELRQLEGLQKNYKNTNLELIKRELLGDISRAQARLNVTSNQKVDINAFRQLLENALKQLHERIVQATAHVDDMVREQTKSMTFLGKDHLAIFNLKNKRFTSEEITNMYSILFANWELLEQQILKPGKKALTFIKRIIDSLSTAPNQNILLGLNNYFPYKYTILGKDIDIPAPLPQPSIPVQQPALQPMPPVQQVPVAPSRPAQSMSSAQVPPIAPAPQVDDLSPLLRQLTAELNKLERSF